VRRGLLKPARATPTLQAARHKLPPLNRRVHSLPTRLPAPSLPPLHRRPYLVELQHVERHARADAAPLALEDAKQLAHAARREAGRGLAAVDGVGLRGGGRGEGKERVSTMVPCAQEGNRFQEPCAAPCPATPALRTLPLPVWPYAKMHTLKPSTADCTRWRVSSNTWGLGGWAKRGRFKMVAAGAAWQAQDAPAGACCPGTPAPTLSLPPPPPPPCPGSRRARTRRRSCTPAASSRPSTSGTP
jgi:hypothetical protein